MFGKVLEVPQTETTPFYPRSPYGVAKVYGHFITVNYRESYDLHATSGILFNHECLISTTPVMIRDNGTVKIVTAPDLVPLARKGPSAQSFTPDRLLEIWDGSGWTTITAITATRRRATDPDHRLLSVEARAGVVGVTAHHHMLDSDREMLRADEVQDGSRLALADSWPQAPGWTSITPEMAEFLGLLAADGHVPADGHHVDFANGDEGLRFRAMQLWSKLFLGTGSESSLASGWNPERTVEHLRLHGAGRGVALWLRDQLYTRTGLKQVPPLVLNGDDEARRAFLTGYYAGDGLKKGNGDSIKTNSPVLAQGVYWLYAQEGRVASVYAEQRDDRTYYQLNLPTAVRVTAKGAHLRRDPAEVRQVREARVADDEWVFDLETESGVFCAGVGGVVVHNSPRRGLEFVTRKITWHAAAIRLGLRDTLTLGNLDSQRDWGYAKDYVKAMWLMLQQDKPEDFVIATGATHSVRTCLEVAFDQAGIPIDGHVELDDSLRRPAEVDQLIGDPSKADRVLGWKPETSFEELIRLMVDADYELLSSRVTS
jgi:GDPmannose 4,6-dehydratase